MRFTRSRTADEHDVVRLFRKGQGRQFIDQTLVDFRLGKLEASQIAMHRKLGRMQLIANRAHLPVRVFGLKQVLDQPA